MQNFLKDFLYPQPIEGVTINTVFISPKFTLFLYIIIFLSLILITIYLLKKRYVIKSSIRKSLVLSFLIASLLYLVYSEFIWYNWFINDWKSLKGLSMEEKLLQIEGLFYDFTSKTEKLIPQGAFYTIYSTDGYFPYRMEYFLLPRKKNPEAEYIIIISDNKSLFDMTTGRLLREDKTISNLELYFFYSNDAYILRKR